MNSKLNLMPEARAAAIWVERKTAGCPPETEKVIARLIDEMLEAIQDLDADTKANH